MSSNTRKTPSKRLRWRPLLQRIKRSFCISTKRRSLTEKPLRSVVISSPISQRTCVRSDSMPSNEKHCVVPQQEEQDEEDQAEPNHPAPYQDAATLAILESTDIAEELHNTTVGSRKSSACAGHSRKFSKSTQYTSVTITGRSSNYGSSRSDSSSGPTTPATSPVIYTPTTAFPNFSRLRKSISTQKRPISRSYERAEAAEQPRHGSTIDEPERPKRRSNAAYVPVHAASDFAMVTQSLSTSKRCQPSPLNFERPSIVEFHRAGSAVQRTARPSRPFSAAYTPVHAASDFSRMLDQRNGPVECVAAVVKPLSPMEPYRDDMLNITEEPSPKSHPVSRFSQRPFLLDLSDTESTHSSASDSEIQVCDYQTFMATSRIASARAARNISRSRSGTPQPLRVMNDVTTSHNAVQHSRNLSMPHPNRPLSRSEDMMRKFGTYIKPIPAEIVYDGSYSRWGSWSDESNGTRQSTFMSSERSASRMSNLSPMAQRSHSRSRSRTSFRDGKGSLWGWDEARTNTRTPQMPISPAFKGFRMKSEMERDWWAGPAARRRDGIYFGNVQDGRKTPVRIVPVRNASVAF